MSMRENQLCDLSNIQIFNKACIRPDF